MHSNASPQATLSKINNRISVIESELSVRRNSTVNFTDIESLEEHENQNQRLTAEYSDLLTARSLQEYLISDAAKKQADEFCRSLPMKMLNKGYRTTKVRFKNGTLIKITCIYYYVKSTYHRLKRKKGLYAALLLLGISDRYTPTLDSTMCLVAASSSSFEEAATLINETLGFKPDVKRIISAVKIMSDNARRAIELDEVEYPDDFSGRVVAASVDGGRIRIRKNKRGKKTEKGRTRYKTDWREPKLIIVYLISEDGTKEKKALPIIDATLGGPDATFELLIYHLAKLNVNAADMLLFVSDGAIWIWDRADDLADRLGIDVTKCFFALDYYHAVEHLSDLANLKSWTKSERKKWVTKQKSRLVKGQLNKFMDEIIRVCKGSKNSKVKREREYFKKHLGHMRYSELREKGLPIGSGAVESGIRRVVNLRLKGPGIFWHEETAEAMLLLRSFYKAGRWKLLKNIANTGRLAIG